MQRTWKDIRVTQSMLRHTSIQSSMKYTEASNEDLRAAVNGMTWTDAAQETTGAHETETVETGPGLAEQLASLSPDRVRQLTALLAVMAERDGRS